MSPGAVEEKHKGSAIEKVGTNANNLKEVLNYDRDYPFR
jgi:hypothetical protein